MDKYTWGAVAVVSLLDDNRYNLGHEIIEISPDFIEVDSVGIKDYQEILIEEYDVELSNSFARLLLMHIDCLEVDEEDKDAVDLLTEGSILFNISGLRFNQVDIEAGWETQGTVDFVCDFSDIGENEKENLKCLLNKPEEYTKEKRNPYIKRVAAYFASKIMDDLKKAVETQG